MSAPGPKFSFRHSQSFHLTWPLGKISWNIVNCTDEIYTLPDRPLSICHHGGQSILLCACNTRSPTIIIYHKKTFQNCAARIVTCTSPHQHITTILRKLHWFPAHSRIEYKILTLTYKAVHESMLHYLCELIQTHTPSGPLRSSSLPILYQPRSNLKTMDDRAFGCKAPWLWNALHEELRIAHCAWPS